MIPGLPSVGGLELIIILVIVLLFFGANRLPQMGRALGHGIKEFRKGISGSTREDKDEASDSKEEEEQSRNGAARHAELSDADKGEEEITHVVINTEQKKN
jgi:sec-independent protein translocase protein TatA